MNRARPMAARLKKQRVNLEPPRPMAARLVRNFGGSNRLIVKLPILASPYVVKCSNFDCRLMTPLMIPSFDFHLVVSSLTTPTTTSTQSLVKTSLSYSYVNLQVA